MATEIALKDDAEVQRISNEVQWAKGQAESLQVIDGDSAKMATAILSEIAKSRKSAESRRLFLVKPLNDHVKSINEWFKGLLAPAHIADTILRQKVLDYRAIERHKADEEARKLREEQDRKAQELRDQGKAEEAEKVKETPLPPPVSKSIDSGMGKTTERLVWEFEIQDFKAFVKYAASNDLEELLKPDNGAIRALVINGFREIPGVKIFQKPVLAVR